MLGGRKSEDPVIQDPQTGRKFAQAAKTFNVIRRLRIAAAVNFLA